MSLRLPAPFLRRRAVAGRALSRRAAFLAALFAAGLLLASPAAAQFVKPFRYSAPRVEPIQGIGRYVHDGKLRLTLRGFLQLVLANDTEIHIAQLAVNSAATGVTSALAPFDPTVSASFGPTRTVAPQYSQISGAATLDTLTQNGSLSYSQTLPTGQSFQVGFSSNRTSSNSQFSTFNPSYATGLNFGVTMPLLENRGFLQQITPLRQAKIALLVSTDQTDAQVANLLVSAADQYWNTVQARDSITVQQQGLALAQKQYQRDEHALQLGALPKEDIYQDQTQVATEQVQVLQAQSAYEQQLDAFRRLIGADLEPATRTMDVVLEDDPANVPETPPTEPLEQAISQALRRRPELTAIQRQLAADSLGVRAGHNAMLPQLGLTGTYGAAGLGGNQIPVSNSLGTGPTAFIPGGFSNSVGQLFGFGYPYYGFSLQFSMPVRNSANAARLTNALITEDHDRYSEREEEQQIIQDVKTANTQILMAAQEVKSAKLARDLSVKNVAAEQQKYQLGTITIFELLQAQVQLSQTQETLLNANVSYQEAIIAYQRATWTLLQGLGLVLTH